ncbi:MAG: hypothetical protein N3G22_02555 [Candidatus Micrarchaeota archaeon]|nr:hypothetical protein [Candidatus Micrarchaeota archaeon]
MGLAAGAIWTCEKIYSRLEKEADEVFEEFLSSSESAGEFHGALERIENQIELASKLMRSGKDFDLNESAVLANKLESDLSVIAPLATGAMLADLEERWAAEFEEAKKNLEALSLHLKKIKAANKRSELKASLVLFRDHAKKCHSRLRRLKALLASKSHPVHSKLALAKNKIKMLKLNVAKAFERLAKQRLRGKIDAAKGELLQLMKDTKKGSIFVDNKHLTFSSNGRRERMLMTKQLRFAIEELVPFEKAFSSLAKGNSVIIGRYEKKGEGFLLSIGERIVAGDTVIYREKSFHIGAHAK